jgi:hypothetical protein
MGDKPTPLSSLVSMMLCLFYERAACIQVVRFMREPLASKFQHDGLIPNIIGHISSSILHTSSLIACLAPIPSIIILSRLRAGNLMVPHDLPALEILG